MMVQFSRAGSYSTPRNFVADTVRRNGALVVHRQVRLEDPFGAATFHFGIAEGHIRSDGNNPLGKEVDV